MKTFFKILFYVIIGLLIALIAFPFVFKDRIIEEVKNLANEELNAEVDFEDIDISLLRSFPQLDLKIQNLSIMGLDTFDGVELLSTKELTFNMSLEPFYNSEVAPEISYVGLTAPIINILVLKDGRANYDITKPDTTESSFYVKLNSYNIKDGSIKYKDLSSNVSISLMDVNHDGKGDFTEKVFDLDTDTKAFIERFEVDGFNYFSKLPVSMVAKINMDLERNRYTLKQNDITIASLKLLGEGFVELNDDNILTKMQFSAPNNDFGQLLSALPYLKSDAKYNADGTFSLTGQLDGIYNSAKNILPAFDVSLNIKNGSANYEDYEFAINDIQSSARFSANKSDWSDLIINIKDFNLKVNDEPIKGSILIDNASTNPNLKGELIMDINLGNWKKALPVDNIEVLNGKVKSNIRFNADLASVNNSDYKNIELEGTASAKNLEVKTVGMPMLTSEDITLEATPSIAKIKTSQSKIGASDFSIEGFINDPLALFSEAKDISGSITLNSKLINLNEWASTESEATDTSSFAISNSTINNINLKVNIDKLLYDQYIVEKINVDGKLGSSAIDLSNFSFLVGESDVQLKGSLLNPVAYMNGQEVLKGTLDFFSNYLDLNQFMSEGEASTEVLRLPDDIDLNMKSSIKKLDYTNLQLTNAKGDISIKGGVAKLEGVSSNIFDGSINLDALYDSKAESPEFDAKINMNRIKFSDAYNNLETFKSIASIIEYVDGFFNTTLVFSGKLTDQMAPDLATMDATGYIETIDSKIKNMQVVEQIGNKLNIDKLKSLAIENTKNWFEVKNGTVTFKEQNLTLGGIEANIGGSHRITGDMSYQMILKIPRAMLKDSKATAIAEQGLSYLEQQAKKLGLNIDQGENIDIKVLIGKTLKNPSIKIIPMGTSGKSVKEDISDTVTKTVQQVKDSIKTKINEKKEELIDTVKSKAQIEIDKAKAKAKAEADKAIDKAKQKADEKIKEVIDSTITGGVTDSLKSKIGDILNTKGTNTEDLEDVIKDWDIFKKKKKKKK